MIIKEIERLIGKFYEGETTLAEEQQLREFFRGDVPDHLVEHRPMFALFEEEQKVEITNPDFDRILFSRLKEEDGRVISMTPRRTRIAFIASLAAAALILVAIALTFVVGPTSGTKYSDSDRLAYAQAEEALMIVSSNLNCGVSHAGYLQAFNKGFEHMEMLSKFYEYQTLIINPDAVQTTATNSK
jgi:hypothetical protein